MLLKIYTSKIFYLILINNLSEIPKCFNSTQNKPTSSAQQTKSISLVSKQIKSNNSFKLPLYKSDCARQYSDFSDFENLNQIPSLRRRRMRPTVQRNGPKLPSSWLAANSSMTSGASSELSLFSSQKGSLCALDRLNQAARRVDKMLLVSIYIFFQTNLIAYGYS